MQDNVLISIKTYQDIDGDCEPPIELQTQGRFGIINNKYYIIYEESDLTGFPDTTTTIKVWEGNAVVSRKGKFKMKIEYAEGERRLCLYPTPYGDVAASVQTHEVEFDFDEKGGRLRVDYSIDPDNETFCKNSLNIKVEPLSA